MTRLESRKRPLSIWVVKLWIGNPKEVEKMYTQESNNKTRNKGHDTRCIRGIETLEKDKRGDDGGARESDIVHWIYTAKESQMRKKNRNTQCCLYSHIGGECIQSVVKVVYLHQNAERNNDTEDVCAGMRELVLTTNLVKRIPLLQKTQTHFLLKPMPYHNLQSQPDIKRNAELTAGMFHALVVVAAVCL